jgi:hypothetical protein
MKRIAMICTALLVAGGAWAKLPPLSDEAKAKAAEAAAKSAHTGKVAAFQLCTSMNRTAERYFADAKKANKEVKPATPTPDCVDPGPFAAAPAAPPADAGKAAAKKP